MKFWLAIFLINCHFITAGLPENDFNVERALNRFNEAAPNSDLLEGKWNCYFHFAGNSSYINFNKKIKISSKHVPVNANYHLQVLAGRYYYGYDIESVQGLANINRGGVHHIEGPIRIDSVKYDRYSENYQFTNIGYYTANFRVTPDVHLVAELRDVGMVPGRLQSTINDRFSVAWYMSCNPIYEEENKCLIQ